MLRSQRPRWCWAAAFLLAPATLLAGSNKSILASVKEMESRDGLIIIESSELHRGPQRDAPIDETYMLIGPAIAPDARAIAWGWWNMDKPSQTGIPFLIVEAVDEGARPVSLEGQRCLGVLGISGQGRVVVARAFSTSRPITSLLAVDLRSGVIVKDLTAYLQQIELADLEQISVSGAGTLVAVGTRERIQVLEIASGRTIYSGAGRFPRLSPDGKRFGFIDQERLYIRSTVDGSSGQFLAGKRVMGFGGWSPDGRLALAGACTKRLSFEKRLTVVDTNTGRYAEIRTLGEGDYGSHFAWVSTKLMPH
jgi:hypothetical protein